MSLRLPSLCTDLLGEFKIKRKTPLNLETQVCTHAHTHLNTHTHTHAQHEISIYSTHCIHRFISEKATLLNCKHLNSAKTWAGVKKLVNMYETHIPFPQNIIGTLPKDGSGPRAVPVVPAMNS